MFLLIRAHSRELRSPGVREPVSSFIAVETHDTVPESEPTPEKERESRPPSDGVPVSLRWSGTIPPELWNRLGTKLIPKLRTGDNLVIGTDISVEVAQPMAESLQADVRQVLNDLNLAGQVTIRRSRPE